MLLDTFESVSETGIIDLSSQVAFTLPLLLVLGAAMSQFSAAVADTVGSGGLVEEVTGGRIHRRWTYAGAVGLALMLLWTVDIFSVISSASRAFALYYAIQCSMAALHAIGHDRGNRKPGQATWFALLASLMLVTAVFDIPADTVAQQGSSPSAERAGAAASQHVPAAKCAVRQPATLLADSIDSGEWLK